MLLRFVILSILLSTNYIYGQRNLIGKSQTYIQSFYNLSGNHSLNIDTINQKSVLLTYKSESQYPFYTYEINLKEDKCISFGIVSKNHNTLRTYLDLLDYVGEMVEADSTYNNFTYQVKNDGKICFFTIKQPYYNSQFLTRRNLFYILVTEKYWDKQIETNSGSE
ncbi:MAG: hypothetical protein DRI95_14390 [Bacteroidetes bacterium]|nr:MAG: hypothetical protein DRI95_14390 [Bacteroidota bacterium]